MEQHSRKTTKSLIKEKKRKVLEISRVTPKKIAKEIKENNNSMIVRGYAFIACEIPK